jgi:hypothetical protein
MRRTAPPPRLALLALVAAVVAAACAPSAQGPGWTTGTSGQAAASGTASAAPGAGSDAGAAPATGKATVVPVIIGSQVKGRYRFVFSFLDAAANTPAGGPDRTAAVAFIPPGSSTPGTAANATFVWAIEGSRGEYVLYTDFPQAGDWKAIFVTQAPGKPQEAIGVAFEVQDDLPVVAVGEKGVASVTPTAADAGGNLKMLSTDVNPDPAFYQLSVADAMNQGKPFVLVFATPAFCQSAQCGPTLQRVKEAAASAPSTVAFINVEPYRMTYTDGRLQPVLDANSQLQPVDSVNDWGILSEPWIFAVDRTGTVRYSFEGVVSDQELRDAIEAIAAS